LSKNLERRTGTRTRPRRRRSRHANDLASPTLVRRLALCGRARVSCLLVNGAACLSPFPAACVLPAHKEAEQEDDVAQECMVSWQGLAPGCHTVALYAHHASNLFPVRRMPTPSRVRSLLALFGLLPGPGPAALMQGSTHPPSRPECRTHPPSRPECRVILPYRHGCHVRLLIIIHSSSLTQPPAASSEGPPLRCWVSSPRYEHVLLSPCSAQERMRSARLSCDSQFLCWMLHTSLWHRRPVMACRRLRNMRASASNSRSVRVLTNMLKSQCPSIFTL